MTLYLVLACAFFVALCLWAERARAFFLIGMAKTAASACFVAIAWIEGAMEDHFTQLIFAGLVLSMLGDVLLLSARRIPFLAGMGAFGLAHIAYSAGFLRMGPFPEWGWAAGIMASLAFCGVVMWRLWPALLSQWKGPVAAYTIVIGAMVALGLTGAVSGQLAPVFALAAVGFAVSDISVANDRLTAGDPWTRIWGLPLYYASQLLFAASL